MRYEASSTIEAAPDAVWAVLADAEGYPAWDSGVEPGRAFPVTVAERLPAQRMVWRGGMPLGLFKGVRTFTLTPDGDATRFEMHEQFSGPLLPVMRRAMPDLGPSFTQFANGLKLRVERGA